MSLTDDELVERVRTTLHRWVDEVHVDGLPTVRILPGPDRSAVPRRSSSRVLAVAAAAVVLVAAAAVLTLWQRPSPARLVQVGPEPSAVTTIHVGARYGVKGLAVTRDGVWMTSANDERLYRIDPATNQVVSTLEIPSHVEGIVAVGDSLWLSRYDPDEVLRVEPSTGALTARLAFDSQPAMATDGSALWIVARAGGDSRAVRIDPDSAEVIDEIAFDGSPGFAALARDSLWVAPAGGTAVLRLDLGHDHSTRVIDVGGEPRDVVAEGAVIWVGVDQRDRSRAGSVVRIDPSTARVTASVGTGRGVHTLAAMPGELWVTNRRDGTVSVIDTRSAELLATSPIGDAPGALAVGYGSVWLTPFRDVVLVRIDRTATLEAAAVPDVAREVEVGSGTMYVRCSGAGSPTVVLEADAGAGVASWAVVEARLSRRVRVCSTDRVGIADPAQADQAGPAATAATDLHDALAQVGESGPFVVVGRGLGALTARMFAADDRWQTLAIVLVDGTSTDFFVRVRPLLPTEVRAKLDHDLSEVAELRHARESAAQVASLGDLGAMPLVVVVTAPVDPVAASQLSDPPLTVAEVRAVGALRSLTQREQAGLSSEGRLVVLGDRDDPSQVVVDEILSLIG
jgi:YVTN family beta-propeller protein